MDKEAMLNFYRQMYGPEAGPWNLGVENKYLEYKITAFFQENFPVMPGADICNVGIGAGAWDRYLSYQLQGGTLTSVDIDALCCRQLREGLILEENPNRVQVIQADATQLPFLEQFDIVTLVGSTLRESGKELALLEKSMSLVKQGGVLYVQTLSQDLTEEMLSRIAENQGMKLQKAEREEKYGFSCGYYKLIK